MATDIWDIRNVAAREKTETATQFNDMTQPWKQSLDDLEGKLISTISTLGIARNYVTYIATVVEGRIS